MSTTEHDYNYPDVLGYITDNQRLNINVVQTALSVRPRVVRAGRPFEVILLMQNAADVPVDVTVTLTVPEKDANKQKGRFLVGTERLVVGLEAAEVGYVKLPVSTLPDTAVAESYTVSMSVEVKPLEKPERVRHPNGGGAFSVSMVDPDKAKEIDTLKQLTYSAAKKGGLFRGGGGTTVEVQFGLLSGKVGSLAKLEPGWERLWTMEDNRDDMILIERYSELISLHTLPALKRKPLYTVLQQKTQKIFEASGYKLNDHELSLITRVLTLILEYANTRDASHDSITAGIYDVRYLFNEKERMLMVETPTVPHWLSAFLRTISKDERVARVPVKAIPHFVYDDLLRDAINYSFHVIEVSTGEDLGTPEEMDEYAQDVITRLKRKGKIGFNQVYMPLVLGGVLLCDRVLIGDERLKDVLDVIRHVMDDRHGERSDETEAVFDMAESVIDVTLKKFGLYDQ